MKKVIKVYDWDGKFLGYARLFYMDEDLTYQLTMDKKKATVLDFYQDGEIDEYYTEIDGVEVSMNELAVEIFDCFTAIFETV